MANDVKPLIIAMLEKYDDWNAERKALADREASGDYPHPTEWQACDDSGIELLDEIAADLRSYFKLGNSDDHK